MGDAITPGGGIISSTDDWRTAEAGRFFLEEHGEYYNEVFAYRPLLLFWDSSIYTAAAVRQGSRPWKLARSPT